MLMCILRIFSASLAFVDLIWHFLSRDRTWGDYSTNVIDYDYFTTA